MVSSIDSDYIYFIEDDYLHLPNSSQVIIEGLERFGDQANLTLYDHPDHYNKQEELINKYGLICLTNSTHWRSIESTTFTFAFKKQNFLKLKNTFKMCNLEDTLLHIQLLQRGLKLFSPMPGFSTHVNVPFFSKLVDWQQYNFDIKL